MNFEIEHRNGFGIIHCHVDLTPATAPELFALLNRLIKENGSEAELTIALDLRHQAAIDATVAVNLVKINTALQRVKRALVLVHAPVTVVNQFGTQLAIADEQLFSHNHKPAVHPSPIAAPVTHAAAAPVAPRSIALDREAVILSALRFGVQQTCLTLCPTLAVKAEEPYVRGKKVIDSDICSALSVKGTTMEGTIVLAFPKAIYLAILSEMHGEKYDDLSLELQDGASELLNMIRSLARGKAKGYLIGKEIPEVSTGSMLAETLGGFQDVLVLPFSALGAHFHILIGLSPHH